MALYHHCSDLQCVPSERAEQSQYPVCVCTACLHALCTPLLLQQRDVNDTECQRTATPPPQQQQQQQGEYGMCIAR